MTTEQLQKILQSKRNFTLSKIKKVIWELKQDCFNEVHKIYQKQAMIKEEQKAKGDTTYKTEINIEDLSNERFYDGEINAFYICLDLLEKVHWQSEGKEKKENDKRN